MTSRRDVIDVRINRNAESWRAGKDKLIGYVKISERSKSPDASLRAGRRRSMTIAVLMPRGDPCEREQNFLR
jgi:hypothetical protein